MSRFSATVIAVAAVAAVVASGHGCGPPPCNVTQVRLQPGTYAAPADATIEPDWAVVIPVLPDEGDTVVETFTRAGRSYRIVYRITGTERVAAHEIPPTRFTAAAPAP